jgi:small GTP-binding protein
MEDDSD